MEIVRSRGASVTKALLKYRTFGRARAIHTATFMCFNEIAEGGRPDGVADPLLKHRQRNDGLDRLGSQRMLTTTRTGVLADLCEIVNELVEYRELLFQMT